MAFVPINTSDPKAHQPELCHYIATEESPGDLYAGALQLATGAAAAQGLDVPAATAWLDAAIGSTFFNTTTEEW